MEMTPELYARCLAEVRGRFIIEVKGFGSPGEKFDLADIITGTVPYEDGTPVFTVDNVRYDSFVTLTEVFGPQSNWNALHGFLETVMSDNVEDWMHLPYIASVDATNPKVK